MKHNRLFLPWIMVVLISACIFPVAVAPTSPAPPTQIPPMASATATVTTYPPLQTAGPYLVYLRGSSDGQQVVILDADGNGRTVLPSPLADSSGGVPIIPPLSHLVSPDGKWLAYYTGSASETSDLALNLMSLADGSTRTVTALLSADYPANFTTAAAELNQPDVTAESLQAAFLAGITRSIAWSPDGRYLAFAGQMDGTSSDLYVYDSQDETIHRLSSGREQVQWIDWSPDGQRIVNESTQWVGEGMNFNIFASSPDGSVVKALSTNTMGITDWLDDHTYLEYDSENGPGNHDLRSVDVLNGSVRTLWNGPFNSYAIDPTDGLLAVSGITDSSQQTGGIYLIKLASGQQTMIQEGQWSITAFPLGGRAFFVQRLDASGEAYFLAVDGSLTPAVIEPGRFSIAPDGRHWISIAGDHLQVYTADDSPVGEISLPVEASAGLDNLLWRTDGSGALIGFYEGSYPYNISSYSLVFVNIASGDAALVDQEAWMLPDFHWVANGE
jgi:Tol biopolymer transport system component